MRLCWMMLLLTFTALPVQAQTVTTLIAPASAATATLIDETAPVTEQSLQLDDLSHSTLELSGMSPSRQFEFGIRGDRLVTQATLDLRFTSSPALLGDISHLKVYFNDELSGTLPLQSPSPDNVHQAQLQLDPRLVGDFNRLRLELVGHYTHVCEDPTSSSIWVALNSDSSLTLRQQALPLINDLSRLPQPFFYERDSAPLDIPLVLPAEPSLEMQKAGAIVASWFGTHAAWRGQRFPATFDTPPVDRHSVVLATNQRLPAFLADYPPVEGPTIEMISHPESPYTKLLLILGRDGSDLVQAASGLALGETLLRGQSAHVEALNRLQPRRPYDAPAWIPTDRPVRFFELVDYATQLQASGMEPSPLSLQLRMPPDLFVWNNSWVDLSLGYRYSAPAVDASSRLDISINGEYLQSFPLKTTGSKTTSDRLQLPLLEEWLSRPSRIGIPALKLGARNQLSFDFIYANRVGGGGLSQECRTVMPVAHQVSVDEQSSIDLSGFPHYLAMPALHTFANAGFPFSRLADLSETLAVMPPTPTTSQLSTLFNSLGRIGAQTGYPGVAVRLSDSWSEAADIDAEILAIGSLPEALQDSEAVLALGPESRSHLKVANTAWPSPHGLHASDVPGAHEVTIRAHGTLAAILGTRSPFFKNRSLIALLAPQPADSRLLNAALNDPSRLDQVRGSLSLIRESGVTSQQIGERYYIGHLAWVSWFQYRLSTHPWWIAGVAALAVLLVAFLLWRILRRLSHRRLAAGEE